MSTDRSLATLLRALQITSQSAEDGPRLLASATTLLVVLTNPRNISLLTSHILVAPAIWDSLPPADIRTSLRVLTSFNNAARHILQREEDSSSKADQFAPPEGLPREEWIRAVVKGADERSLRWKHLLVLGGILTGFEANNKRGLSVKFKEHMEEAIVTATNLALQEPGPDGNIGGFTIIMTLSHCFDLLRPMERQSLDVDHLLPLLIQGIFFSREGLHSGYFLGFIDPHVVQDQSNKFSWSVKSPSFHQTQSIATGPIVSSLGVLSRITAFCVEMIQDVESLFKVVEDLGSFGRSLSTQWQQNKLSELDVTEEEQYLSAETLQRTLPLLWQVLKSAMFATIIIQSSIISRALRDRYIPVTQMPFVAVQTLHTLRNFYFVSSRIGHTSFSQFNFVYTAAIDILARYPRQAEAFLREIRPHKFGQVADHPYERSLDLFFLNTAEHFTLVAPQDFCEDVLLGAAQPYLGNRGDQRLNEIFEAAHSVYLAVFSAPLNYNITIKHLPLYVEVLFSVFPEQLSARQFRLAIQTLTRITSPPFRIAQSQPMLGLAVLEMIRHRAVSGASTYPLPPLPSQGNTTEPVLLSEQSALVLALIDSLPHLSLPYLEEWLPLTADTLNEVHDSQLRETCKQRFWEIISNGQMDVPRAEFCVKWWNTMGGRQAVLYGVPTVVEETNEGPFMSGALGEASKL